MSAMPALTRSCRKSYFHVSVDVIGVVYIAGCFLCFHIECRAYTSRIVIVVTNILRTSS